jgi:hypothetical protein
MPDDTARRFQRGGLLLTGSRPLRQRKRCHLWVSNYRKTADIGDVCRRQVHDAAKTPDPLGDDVHVVDPDISDPPRRRAHSLRLLRQVHQPADRGLTGGKHHIGDAAHRRVHCAPSDDLGIEDLGRLWVRCHQFVPDETAMRIDHVGFSRSSLHRGVGTGAGVAQDPAQS